jgi:hypothetical protein
VYVDVNNTSATEQRETPLSFSLQYKCKAKGAHLFQIFAKGKLGWVSNSTRASHLDLCPAWKQAGQFQTCNRRIALTNIQMQKCRPPCLIVEILKFIHDQLSLIKKIHLFMWKSRSAKMCLRVQVRTRGANLIRLYTKKFANTAACATSLVVEALGFNSNI